MRLSEGQVRAYVYSLNQESKCKYRLRQAYSWWQLYCEDAEDIVSEGYSGSLREVYEVVRGIRAYLRFEKQKEEGNGKAVQG